jgi:hypothetical protein
VVSQAQNPPAHRGDESAECVVLCEDPALVAVGKELEVVAMENAWASADLA